MNLLSGTVRLPTGNLPILWTGENANHLMIRINEARSGHPFNHIEAQQNLKLSKFMVNVYKNRFVGLILNYNSYVSTVFIKHPNFAEIKTSIFNNQTPQKAIERYKIEGTQCSNLVGWDMPAIHEAAEILGVSSELLMKKLAPIFLKNSKKKRKRN